MIAVILFVLTILALPFKSKIRLEAENAALWQQLIVLQRRMKGRATLTNSDRWFFVQLYRWFPTILNVLAIIRPETLVRWHRTGFSLLLAFEITATSRRTASSSGAAGPDTTNECGEPAVGCASHPRRTAQAGVRGFSIQRRQTHGQATGAAEPGRAIAYE